MATKTDTQQAVSDRGTAAVLVATMLAVGFLLWQLTGWNLTVWWRALVLGVASYLITAVLLLGIDAFVSAVVREYRHLR